MSGPSVKFEGWDILAWNPNGILKKGVEAVDPWQPGQNMATGWTGRGDFAKELSRRQCSPPSMCRAPFKQKPGSLPK